MREERSGATGPGQPDRAANKDRVRAGDGQMNATSGSDRVVVFVPSWPPRNRLVTA